MRLVTYEHEGSTAAGRLDGTKVTPVGNGSGAAPDICSLLEAGAGSLDGLVAEAESIDLEAVRVLNPIPRPGAIFCVGLNYRSHILEMGRDIPEAPTLFSKLPRALTGPGATIPLPEATQMVDYEAEFTAVIGHGGRDIPTARAWDHVVGLTLMNDVSMRDFQRRSLQWFAGKTWESSTPVGPWLTTVDELERDDLELELTVNGEGRQQGRIDDLVFGVADLIADISRIVELRPGDLIATGTPGGVGVAMDPKQFLRNGDVVEISAGSLGTLSNRFVSAQGG